MAKRGFQGKKLSTNCSRCGVEWLADMSNKVIKRAVCYPCLKVEYEERKEAEQKKVRINREVTLVEKKKPYTFKNRKPFWDEVRTNLKGMKTRAEWLPYIRLQMDRILNDTQLMDYLNDTEIANYDRD